VEARTDEAKPPAPAAGDEPPPLPPIEELTFDSDISAFMHPKVGEDVRRAAFRKLFSDPRFNVMDGLDVYIDDYSQPDPLPPGMLEKLTHWQTLLTAGRRDEAPVPGDPPQEPAAAAGHEAAAPPEPLPEPAPPQPVVAPPVAREAVPQRDDAAAGTPRAG
jgi:hypothetical protein